MSHRVVMLGGLTLSSVLFLSVCSKSEPASTPAATAAAPAQPAAAPASPAAAPAAAASAPMPAATPAPAAAPASAPIASATYAADSNVRCDLLEVRRVSGGAILVKWRIVNTAGGPQAGSLTASAAKPASYDFAWADLYYLDPAENKKYSFLTDSEGNRILDVFYGSLNSGEQRANWAKFPAPPPTSTKISLMLPKFPPFEDVPVAP